MLGVRRFNGLNKNVGMLLGGGNATGAEISWLAENVIVGRRATGRTR